ncbi:MAG: YfcE family phosphodiesterase [Bacteroidetes bacterium GWA2_32_17]|nr:MAG: YfcE family phosphodiesterase [Bacteroidetes bacterium GWA2_32_17]
MKTIGLLSDTHNYIDDVVYTFFSNCDEIWHAGDFGNIETADKLAKFKPLKGVYGNIDDHNVRNVYPEFIRFNCEGVDTLITHIGGYPQHYNKNLLPVLKQNPPKLLITGHSHILRIMYDNKFNLLFINPGAAGNYGFHKQITMVRFVINKSEIKDVDVYDRARH